MWAETTKDGRVKFREQYKDPLTGKHKKVSITFDKNTNTTRRKAQIALESKIQHKLRHVDDGTIKKGVTLGELIDEWLPIYKNMVKEHTYINNKSRATIIRKTLGEDVLVANIKPVLLSNYLDDLIYKKNYKNSSVQKFKGTLGNLLRYAKKHNYIKTNPIKEADVNYKKSSAADKIEEKYFDEEELNKILKYMYKRSPHYGRFCEFLYQTGLRFGEAAALIPNDIIEKDGKQVAVINSTLVNKKKQPSPKTAKSNRDVTLSKRALEIIHDEEKEANGTQFIFSSGRYGYPMNNTTLNDWLREAKKELNIQKITTVHTFRHTHISKLAELGVPLYLIQNRVGHKDATTTKDIYLHVTKKAEQQLDSNLDKL